MNSAINVLATIILMALNEPWEEGLRPDTAKLSDVKGSNTI
jgi:hypothetical protein